MFWQKMQRLYLKHILKKCNEFHTKLTLTQQYKYKYNSYWIRPNINSNIIANIMFQQTHHHWSPEVWHQSPANHHIHFSGPFLPSTPHSKHGNSCIKVLNKNTFIIFVHVVFTDILITFSWMISILWTPFIYIFNNRNFKYIKFVSFFNGSK